MTFTYKPTGVCSTMFEFEIEGDIVTRLDVARGCGGNSKGIAALLAGRNVDDIITTLEGISCGQRATSCPDQIAKALKDYKENK